MEALWGSLIQVGVFIAAIYVVGFLISLLNRLFYFLMGDSPAVVYVTGFIGTPIHELSHALFCLIFAHRIEEIKLFQISDEDGTLGYVEHSYNKRNVYQIVGNFFIGVAPILIGTSFLILMMWLITPTTFDGVNLAMAGTTYQNFFPSLWETFLAFFRGAADWRWWLYLLLVLFVAIHMNLSKADLKGTVIAIPFMIALIFGVNYIIWAVSKPGYEGFLSAMTVAETYALLFLSVSLFFASLCLVPAVVVYIIRRITGNA